MSDNRTSAERKKNMQAVKSKNSVVEIKVRKLCHKMGYRFRLHRKDIPGTPDLVFPKLKLCIFVHGCFWHQHSGCKKATLPKTNIEFWKTKLTKNIKRDEEIITKLHDLGWHTEIIWECETKNIQTLERHLKSLFLKHENLRHLRIRTRQRRESV
jgi:DNA mismatch endonuclease (patch repair protein)